MATFTLEKKTGSLGELIKTHDSGEREPWGTVEDFDQLFDACVKRWGKNWDLNKVCVSIRESNID